MKAGLQIDEINKLLELYVPDFVNELLDKCITEGLDFETADELIYRYAEANGRVADDVNRMFNVKLEQSHSFG